MSKIALAVIALGTFGVAQAATLDVHGDIKINGKTVITETGQIIDNETVDLSKYLAAANGTSVLEGTYKNDTQTSSVKMIITADGKHTLSQTDYTNGEEVWKMVRSDFTENSVTVTTTASNCSLKFKDTYTLNTKVQSARLGETATAVAHYDTVTDDFCYNHSPIPPRSLEIIRYTPLAFTKWSNGDLSYNDCLVYLEEGAWNNKLKTSCIGVSTVEITNYNDQNIIGGHYKLTSFTPN
ncbi:hypothetical protein K6Y31_13250 [Motilimonas cestriensis]|uniref:Uncharacterized protein n=1 Tax=Motilimonas cestriensis TaxID=2742685 RepID=A0ABS8WBV3_9GAMM|nr:hypothetical protein [Motilimonas cestriensis]MCE2595772.1 hypothetical protein [Motilimonas cestriensis]